MSRIIIDKKQVAANLDRALRINAAGAGFLFDRALGELEDRLAVTQRDFGVGVVVGPLPDRVADRLLANGKVDDACIARIDDREVIDCGDRAPDLIVSLMHLHQVNDVPGALIQMRRALKPDGLLLACAPGAGTLGELRGSLLDAEAHLVGGAHARVLPFMDVRNAGGLLQRAGFALPVADTDEVIVRYDTPFDLMRDLRAMGSTNTLADRPRTLTRRSVLMEAAARYAREHADNDGRIRATFRFVWMSGWSPDESQPKPLRPGTAKRSLAAVLNDRSAS